MITTSTAWLDVSIAVLTAGLVLGALLSLTAWDRRRQDRAALHVAQHRPAELPPAPVEVIRPVANPEEHERTEETPRVEAPVAHHEAAEQAPVEGAIGTVAVEDSPEMAEAVWRHEHDKRWTALLVGWAERPPWLAEFGADSLQLPEYRRLVLEHTGEIPMAALLEAGVR